jgi:molecular chaperone GrpE
VRKPYDPNAPQTGPETAQQPGPADGADPEETVTPKVHDNRRIDPETYQLREPEAAAETAASAPAGTDEPDPAAADVPEDAVTGQTESDELASVKQALADRTADLQRVQAEYVNYKRRTDRDRTQARSAGVESVIRELLPVLDSVQYAREHEELTGGFKGVADELDGLARKHGVEAFGAEGDAFDPHIHEALMNAQAEGITQPTCVTILQPGYTVGGRVVRPARVAVAEPESGSAAAAAEEPAAGVVAEPVDDPGNDGFASTEANGQSPDSAGDSGSEHHDRGTAGQ